MGAVVGAVLDQSAALLSIAFLLFVLRFRPWRWVLPWVRRG